MSISFLENEAHVVQSLGFVYDLEKKKKKNQRFENANNCLLSNFYHPHCFLNQI